MSPNKNQLEAEERLSRNKELLEAEAESRARRIKSRQRQRLKEETLRRIARRKRRLKLAVIWIGSWTVILIGALYAATWFSADFVNWLNGWAK
ncbi:MAG: hypothetical protein HQ503_06670 [Rhodospirillales bacterium]|nr:hypothetical protein [Rhodospirillales bacterium]